MKVWACVYVYCGSIGEQRVFKNRDSAERWFKKKVEALVDKKNFDMEDCSFTGLKKLYFFNCLDLGKPEVKCELIEEED